MESIFNCGFQSKVVNAGGSCWISGNCLQGNHREAKAVQADDSLGLNHPEWPSLLYLCTSELFFLSFGVIFKNTLELVENYSLPEIFSSLLTFLMDKPQVH